MTRPTQAVILAGGRGSRLRPLTDACPKPMLPFHGRPFLDYLLELVKEQGFERVLLLLGYLPEAVTDYCGDGSRWGLRIDYSVSAVEDDTGRRLRLARSKIDPVFLLLQARVKYYRKKVLHHQNLHYLDMPRDKDKFRRHRHQLQLANQILNSLHCFLLVYPHFYRKENQRHPTQLLPE